MRALAITLCLGLAGCVGATASGLDGYASTYDNLKQVQADCAANGGTLTLRRGGDQQNLADYACKRN